jgi:hypothetical protein
LIRINAQRRVTRIRRVFLLGAGRSRREHRLVQDGERGLPPAAAKLRNLAMTWSTKAAIVIAVALMLAPPSIQTGTSGAAGAGLEPAGARPAYPACGFAKRDRICWSGQGLVSAGGRRQR